jgi:hypothetical protein
LELDADLSNPAMSVSDMGPGAGLPTPQLIAWDNLYQDGTNAFLNYNVQGSLVVLTNVYFGTNAGLVTTNGNYALTVTNSQGKIGHLELYAGQDNDLTNRTMPTFAYAIMGPLVAYTTGYEVAPTRWSDVVTTAPAITLATPANGASFTAPANISLTATVTANGYTVNAVNYYNGATFIGSASTPPYTYAWNGVGAGTKALSAQVVYSMFGLNTFTVPSGINSVTVNAPLAPVSSVGIAPGAGNSLNISYAGGSASQFVLVGTNNITAPLATWPVIQTTNGTTPAVFNIPIGAGQMFYKIKSQ